MNVSKALERILKQKWMLSGPSVDSFESQVLKKGVSTSSQRSPAKFSDFSEEDKTKFFIS